MKSLPRNIDAYATYGIAILAFALSYSKLTDLALRAGYGQTMAHAWPIIVDGLAIVATRGVMRLRSNSRWYAWTLLGASTAVSIVAAVANAMFPAGPLPPLASAAVSVVPPLCLLVAPHLAVKLHRDTQQVADAPVAEPEPQAPEVAPAEVADPTPPVADPEVAPTEEPATLQSNVVALTKVAPRTKQQINQEKRAEAIRLGATRRYKKRQIARMVDASDTSVRRWLSEAGIAEDEPEQVALTL